MAVSRRGLSRGLQSRSFPVSDLLEAARDDALQGTEFLDLDATGQLSAGAQCTVRARLAPHVHACNVVLSLVRGDTSELSEPSEPLLRLRMARDVAPLQELLLWFDEDLLAALDMPFLTLRNIHGRREYSCHECGARFEEPNPLKTHLFLRCAALAPVRFWRVFAARLAPVHRPTAAPASAFRRVTPAAPSCSLTAPEAAMARLEALATEWGRRGPAGSGAHACVYCGKLYSRKYGLKIHLRTHTGYRPLRCRHCARAFGDPSNLNKHVRLHTAGASGGAHTCTRCGKALARRRDLERHQRTHCTALASVTTTTTP